MWPNASQEAAMDNAVADQIIVLANRVKRLMPDRHCPERFFEERDEISSTLHRLARESRKFQIA
jgi:hypothetical protein